MILGTVTLGTNLGVFGLDSTSQCYQSWDKVTMASSFATKSRWHRTATAPIDEVITDQNTVDLSVVSDIPVVLHTIVVTVMRIPFSPTIYTTGLWHPRPYCLPSLSLSLSD